MRGGVVEGCDHELSGARSSDAALAHDLARGDLAAVDLLVGAVVLAKRGTFERDASEQPAAPRVGEDFSTHQHVSGSFGVASLGTGCSGCVATQLDLALQKRL